MSVYLSKIYKEKMAIQATLQTKLACSALTLIIINVCILIAIIAFVSKGKTCNMSDEKGRFRNIILNDEFSVPYEFQATIKEYPWMVAFVIMPERLFVGSASIISRNWVLTTAYCVEKVAHYPLSKKGFSGGSHFWNKNGYFHFAAQIIPHESFDPQTLDYNIALAQVSHPFEHNYEVPVSLAGKKFKLASDTAIEVVGWALLNRTKNISDYLLKVNVILMPKDVCQEVLTGKRENLERIVCGNRDSNGEKGIGCIFISGGALIANKKLIGTGLISWNVICEKSRLPGLYVNIRVFLNWLREIKTKQEISAQVVNV